MNVLIWTAIGIFVSLVLGLLVFFITVRQAAEYESRGTNVETLPSSPAQQIPDLDADVIYDARRLMDDGKKAAAINLVRDASNLDLQTAKNYVETLVSVPVGTPVAQTFQPIVPPARAPLREGALSSAALQEVQALMAQGKQIFAIKKVREFTGWGLKESKDYVDALPPLGQMLQVPTYARETSPVIDAANMDTTVRELLAQHKKIEAVKLVRATTGWGLKKSKMHVDAIQRQEF